MNFNNPIISGNTGGTPITHLRRDVAQKLNENENNNDNESEYSVESIKTTTDIKQLVDEINNNVKNRKNVHIVKDKPKKKKKIIEKQIEKHILSNTNKLLEDSVYDGILLLIIYLLMSQSFVKNFLGTYIKAINVNSEGYVQFKGVFIYGLIFTVVFLSLRFIIQKVSD